MKINIKVTPKSSKNELIKLSKDEWKVKITSVPVDGKANQGLIKFLAQELGIKKNQIKIIKGKKSREKVIEIKK